MSPGATDLALDAALASVAGVRRLLVATDFDGTLAPLVADPADSVGLPDSMDALRLLADLPDTWVAVVSGRARADLARLADLPEHVLLVGSHGAELGADSAWEPADLARRDRLVERVAELAVDVPGVILEPKPTGVTVHVRQASRPDAARVLAALHEGPGADPDVHVTSGKEMLELHVVRADKGTALDALRSRTGADAVLFVGDDVTDEAAFHHLRGVDVGIKVGGGASAAAHRVATEHDVTGVLRRLLLLRSHGAAARS